MKTIKILSIIAAIVSFVIAILIIGKPNNKKIALIEISNSKVQLDSLNSAIQKIKVHNIQSNSETITMKNHNAQLTQLQNKIEKYRQSKSNQTKTSSNNDLSSQILWIKVIFSLIFCLAALYVVLSKKFDDEKEKWAFSVLTLILGFWVGTI